MNMLENQRLFAFLHILTTNITCELHIFSTNIECELHIFPRKCLLQVHVIVLVNVPQNHKQNLCKSRGQLFAIKRILIFLGIQSNTFQIWYSV